MSLATKAVSALVTTLLCVALAAASQWGVTTSDDSSLLRLSWRIEPLRVEECRTLSASEQAEIPAHMRRAQECTGFFVDYELRVAVDDTVALYDTIAPSGLRRDRPVYVLRDLPLEPASHDVRVAFRALVPQGYEPPDDARVTLEWGGTVDLEARRIALVTLDPSGTRLERR